MRVLGIETSGEVAGAAVADGDGLLSELAFRHRMELSRRLESCVVEACALAGIGIRELDGIAVSVGPGSFTGLRIGVTAAKTLAYALGIPVAAVPTLEAIAAQVAAPAEVLICAAIRASPREVFTALYQRRADARGARLEMCAGEVMIPAVDLARRVAGSAIPILVAGPPGPHRDLLGGAAVESHPRPSTIALLGRERLLEGTAEPVHDLAPRYLRLSTPEIRRQEAECRTS